MIAGSLLVSLTDPGVYLAGASGGVYSLITSHLANIIANWEEMEFAGLRLATFLLVAGVDVGVAVFSRHFTNSTNKVLTLCRKFLGIYIKSFQVSYMAHIAGATVGLLLGIVVLKNFKLESWETYLWWSSLTILILLFVVGIIWNLVVIF